MQNATRHQQDLISSGGLILNHNDIPLRLSFRNSEQCCSATPSSARQRTTSGCDTLLLYDCIATYIIAHESSFYLLYTVVGAKTARLLVQAFRGSIEPTNTRVTTSDDTQLMQATLSLREALCSCTVPQHFALFKGARCVVIQACYPSCMCRQLRCSSSHEHQLRQVHTVSSRWHCE